MLINIKENWRKSLHLASMDDDDRDRKQQEVFAFFSRQSDRRIDTHASVVFLEKARALKFKRAIRLPFLDYSTLEKRRAACEEELIVNKIFAPKLYKRVVAITENETGFEVSDNGSAVEWAVEMARFDENATLDHLARKGPLDPTIGEKLAKCMYRSHRDAHRSDGSTWLSSVHSIVERNTDAFDEMNLPKESIERLGQLSETKIHLLMPLLRERASNGLVRRCHGDAHLGNVVIIDDEPVLFDALEFDPVLATTDTLYDLAFPIMDFIYFGLEDSANRLFNCYLAETWQDSANSLTLLSLFLSMRAAIRANVTFAKSRLSNDESAKIALTAELYFEQAMQHLKPAAPSLIAIGGRSGTGKSVLARDIASLVRPSPGAVILRSDFMRKQMFGVNALTHLPSYAYEQKVSDQVYERLLESAQAVLRQGFSVIIDAAFLREAERCRVQTLAEKMRFKFRSFFLEAPLLVRSERVRSRSNDASDATPDVAAAQEGYDIGILGWPIVDASGTPDQTRNRALAIWR